MYGIQIWGVAADCYIRKLQTILNNTARFVLKKGRRTKTRELMDKMGWMSIEELVKYHSLISMWKLTRKNIPIQIASKIQIQEDWTLTTKAARLVTTSRGFRWNTIKLWNTMELVVRAEPSLPRFKRSCKQWLLLLRTEQQPQTLPPQQRQKYTNNNTTKSTSTSTTNTSTSTTTSNTNQSKPTNTTTTT